MEEQNKEEFIMQNNVFSYTVVDPLTTFDQSKTADIQDISNLKLVKSDDPILKDVMPSFDFKIPSFDPIEFAKSLVKVMIDNNGLGLSANQVGIKARVFAMLGEPNLVCYNPTILGRGEEEDYLEEGCLSFPGLYVKIRRWKSIKTRFTMPNGEVVNKTFGGLSARIFQHELSHLNGIVPLGETNKFSIIQSIEKCRKKSKMNYYLKNLLNKEES